MAVSLGRLFTIIPPTLATGRSPAITTMSNSSTRKRNLSSAYPGAHQSAKRVQIATATARDGSNPVASTSNGKRSGRSSGNPTLNPASFPSAHIVMPRCLLSTQCASRIFADGDARIKAIRTTTSARVLKSPYIDGDPKRLVTVSGPLDSVAVVCSVHIGTVQWPLIFAWYRRSQCSRG